MLKVYSNSIIGTNLLDIINTSPNTDTSTIAFGNQSTNAYTLIYNNQNIYNGYLFGKSNNNLIIDKLDSSESIVGIGKTNPAYTLDVSGSISITNDIYMNSSLLLSSNLNLTVNNIFNDTLNINGSGCLYNSNMSIYRNHIINGAMNIDSFNTKTNPICLNSFGPTQTVTYTNTLDRWNAVCGPYSSSLVSTQVALGTNDINALDGVFTNAVCLSAVPTNGLIANIPFNNNSYQDNLGYLSNVIALNPVFSSSNAIVGNGCIDFTSNVQGLDVVANTYLAYRLPSLLSPPITISFWVKQPAFNTYATNYFTFSSSVSTSVGLLLHGYSTNNYLQLNQNTNVGIRGIAPTIVQTTNSISLTANVWNHITLTIDYDKPAQVYTNGNAVLVSPTSVPGYGNFIDSYGSNIDTITFANRVNNYPGSIYMNDFRMYNRILTQNEITTLANNTGIYQNPVSGNDLLINYKFDGNLLDSTDNNYNLITSSNISYVPGIVGTNALWCKNEGQLTTANQYNVLSYAYTDALNIPISNITVSAWIYLSTSNAGNGFPTIIYISCQNNYYYAIKIDGSRNLSVVYGDSLATTITPLQINTWTHVLFTINNNIRYVYVNGIFQLSTSLDNTKISTQIYGITFGGRWNYLTVPPSLPLTRPFAGYIDDFRLYNRALSPAEIYGIYMNSPRTSYVLYKQPIKGYNLTDLQWGTPNAQPVTVSSWIKNNSAQSQQFTLGLDNNVQMQSYLPFNNSINDETGQCTVVGASNWTPSYVSGKVGANALSLTNTNSLYATPYVDILPIQIPSSPPISVSLWAQYRGAIPTTVTYEPTVFIIGPSINNTTAPTINISITNTSNINFNIITTNTQSTNILYTQTLVVNSWYNFAFTYDGNYFTAYVNGNLIGSVNATGNFMNPSVSSLNNYVRIGDGGNNSYTGTPYTGWNGYVDDLRIYNSLLTPSQINTIYQNNANSTTSTTYLIPRTILYKTPTIEPNSWKNVIFSVPGDKFGYWNFGDWSTITNSTGLNLGLCLGASSGYTSSFTLGNTWLYNTVVYTAQNTQINGLSSNNFLANIANSLYLTGVQLEIGSYSSTFFENRPPAIENTINMGSDFTYTNGNLLIGINAPAAPLIDNSIVPTGNQVPYYGNISAGNLGMFRNRVINGDMSIAQRGTSFTIPPTSAASSNFCVIISNTPPNRYYVFPLDRYFIDWSNTSGNLLVTQQTLTTTDTPFTYGFNNSMRFTATTALTISGYLSIRQNIEGVNIADFRWGTIYGTPVTISVWICTNVVAGTLLSISLRNFIPYNNTYDYTFSATGNDAWQYVSFTVPPPPVGSTWYTDTSTGIELYISTGNRSTLPVWNGVRNKYANNIFGASGNYLEFTGLQLEKGTIVTPFEFRPYDIELNLCMRYFQTTNLFGMTTMFYSTTGCSILASLPVEMRTPLKQLTNDTNGITGCIITSSAVTPISRIYCASTNTFITTNSLPVSSATNTDNTSSSRYIFNLGGLTGGVLGSTGFVSTGGNVIYSFISEPT